MNRARSPLSITDELHATERVRCMNEPERRRKANVPDEG